MSETLSEVSPSEIKERILNVLKSNNAIMIATTGGEYSPWILGAYYASDDLKIYLLIETGGKSYANIQKNKDVAICISKNDAMEDFVQGQGTVTVLPEDETENVRAMLLEKMPWFKTFTPIAPIRIDIKKYFITSVPNGWFPAKVYEGE